MKVCDFPGCRREARFLMGWDNENGKHFGHVCATCDRKLGRMNLVKYISLVEAIAFESYLKETVNLPDYPDFPQWLTLRRDIKAVEKFDYDAAGLRELNLPSRAFNALYRRQITVDELVDMPVEDLIKIRMIGLDGVAAIQKALKEYEGG